MLYTQNHENHRAHLMKITLRLYQAIQTTSEDQIVQKYSRQTNVHELHCQMCVRQAR